MSGVPLNSVQASQLSRAFQLLSMGNLDEALGIARRLTREAPNAPDAQQLLAMCCADAGQFEAADATFQRALQLAPGNTMIMVNHATMLSRFDRSEQALAILQQVVKVAPFHSQAWTKLGLAATALGRLPEAMSALSRAVELQPNSASAWLALGNAQRAANQLEAAEQALQKAVTLAPDHATAWACLAAVTRLLGRPNEAIGHCRRAERAGFAGPELSDLLAGTLRDDARMEEALAEAEQLVRTHPEFAPGYLTLAHILWENSAAGHADQATTMLRNAVQRHPQNHQLRLIFARFLLAAQCFEEALENVRFLRAIADQPALALLEANALDSMGRTDAAGAQYRSLHAALGRSDPTYLHAHARHRLRVGEAAAAEELALAATRLNPNDQEAWAYLATAWRLMDDPREHWLCDYQRLIGLVAVEPPPGFSGVADFLTALQATLEPLHRAKREPVQQSLRGGSQTSGRLFGGPNPLLKATHAVLVRAVESWVQQLPTDPTHPCLSRKSTPIRFTGSWSVRLRSSGKHVNHFHPDGWLSSAFYVLLPPSVANTSDPGKTDGCIQFGQPPLDLELNLPPRRIIRPQEGYLALFPSYLWHGTVPFEAPEARMTIAFDMVPESR